MWTFLIYRCYTGQRGEVCGDTVNEKANSLDSKSQLLHTTIVLHIRQDAIQIPYRSLRRDVDSIRILTDYWLNDRGSTPGKRMQYYIGHNIRTASAAHKASYPISTGDAIPGDGAKATET